MKVYELTAKIREFKLVLAYAEVGESNSGDEWCLEAEAASKVLNDTIHNAIRIVRLDAFQLARVVESSDTQYRIVTRCSGSSERKEKVLDTIRRLCQAGHIALKKVAAERNEVQDYPLAEDVKTYVSRIIDITKSYVELK